jgi:membrane associated rhomboid family serine protease
MKPFRPPSSPVATNSLIGLCVAVQAAVTLLGATFGDALDARYGLVPARMMAAIHGQLPLGPQLLTLVTHQFLHAGWAHLLLNTVFLAWVGRYVEWVGGRTGLALLFLVGGIAGAVVQVSASPASMVPVVGASGAISAVFGAYAAIFARGSATSRRILGVSVSGEVMNLLWMAASWIGLQLLIGLVFNTGGSGIAIWAHIGGFLTGLLLGRPLARL